ncbi:MAG: type II toxin-antitoxin system RelE/ParE family toxin [Anaerosomatales bacterium]|nr:type II toxin-antitoxin system RelE/ParE family toxin [Anaerosomatales bacterium]
MARVTFAESAVRDLEEVRDWYSSKGVPEVGLRLVGEAIASLEQAARFPESGRVVPEFGTPRLRELVRPPFRIVYRVDDDGIVVVRVWRSERLMQEP